MLARREPADIPHHQRLIGDNDAARGMAIPSLLDPQQDRRSIGGDGQTKIDQVVRGQRLVLPEHQDLAGIFQISDQLVGKKRNRFDLLRVQRDRIHLSDPDVGMIVQAIFRKFNHVFVVDRIDPDRLSNGNAFEPRPQRFHQVRQWRAGKAQQTQRHRPDPALHQPQLTIVAQAFEALHQIDI